MGLAKLEQLLQGQSTELYKFAYALVSDESVAQKTLTGALRAFFVEEADFIREFCRRPLVPQGRYIRRYLHGKVYLLAKRAMGQVKTRPDRDFAEFYKLSVKQRAILFLKHKTDFSYDELEEILNLFKHEVMAHLFDAREQMIKYLGLTSLTERQ